MGGQASGPGRRTGVLPAVGIAAMALLFARVLAPSGPFGSGEPGTVLAELLADRPGATWLWAKTVLHVIGPSPRVSVVVAQSRAAGRRDACFSAPLAYGALWTMSAGDDAGANDLLREGARACPDEPWFPSVLALRLRDAGDPSARAWMAQAATLPGAPEALAIVAGRWAEEER